MKVVLLVFLLVLGACAPPVAANHPDAANNQEAEAQGLQRLEAEARALARADGCARADQCRTAPVGDRPCGGPRNYLVYCAATTDTVALFRKLDELKRAEQEFNRKHGLVSTCEYRMPPQTQLLGTTCRAR